MRVRVCAYHYEPFRFGSPDQYYSAEVEVVGEYDVGKGFYAYLAVAPNGETKVANKECGCFVGDTIQQVKDDIASCKDLKFMKKQMEEGRQVMEKAHKVSEEEFWKILGKSVDGEMS